MYPGDTPGRARAEMELFQGKCAHDQDAQTRLRQVKEYLAALNSRPTNSRPPSTGISGSNAPSIPDRFGALAIDRAHGDFYGWAVGFASQAEADSRVQDECSIKSTSCTNVMRFRNTCAAYAIDPVTNSTAYGWAYSAQRSNAESMALENCRQRGGDSAQCLIRVWGCTGG